VRIWTSIRSWIDRATILLGQLTRNTYKNFKKHTTMIKNFKWLLLVSLTFVACNSDDAVV
jgi:hypothetical protein